MAVDIGLLIAQINELSTAERIRVLAEVSAALAKDSRHVELEHVASLAYAELSLEQLAQEQKVRPISSLDELKSSAWPQDESAQDFLDWLAAQRRQDLAGEP